MDKKDAEKLTAHIFHLEQELNRGTWNEDEEAMKLIEFAKSFEEKVKGNEKLNTTAVEESNR